MLVATMVQQFRFHVLNPDKAKGALTLTMPIDGGLPVKVRGGGEEHDDDDDDDDRGFYQQHWRLAPVCHDLFV